MTWSSARIDCGLTSTLIISPSRTDYLWILEEAQHLVEDLKSVTVEDMQRIMFYIVLKEMSGAAAVAARHVAMHAPLSMTCITAHQQTLLLQQSRSCPASPACAATAA